ncbi:MAG TPA: S8 family serine peptidase [Steroidobacter sp.]|nr:S8 family serine peptidase [Steroidobacter sp.]
MSRLPWIWLPCLLFAGCAAIGPGGADVDFSKEDPGQFVVVTLRSAGASTATRAGSTPREYGAVAQYGVAAENAAAIRAMARRHGLATVRQWPISQLGVDCIVFRIGAGQTQAEVLKRLQTDAHVESAQPLNSFSVLSAGYNDRYVGLQHSLSTMGVLRAHQWSRGEGVRIAVIDTAVDLRHPDLVGGRIKAMDFTGLKQAAAIHGTAVAGVIAAQADNEIGIVGVAPDAQVHALAACWPDARDASRAVCNTFTLASALATAIDLGARIVNLSLGGPNDPLLRRLVAYGLSRGVIFVGAAPPNGAFEFPCSTPGVISAGVAGHASPDGAALLAPGVDVLTLTTDGGYDFLSGSSMAAAHVSGAIALLLARERRLGGDEVRSRLSQSASSSIDVYTALNPNDHAQRPSTQ